MTKLLLDSDVSARVKEMLERLGYEIRTAYELAVPNKDHLLLRWARENEYIFVTHDEHRDLETRELMTDELKRNGGHVLCIRGAQRHNPDRTVGKILLFRDRWELWFSRNNGLVELTQEYPKYVTPEEYVRVMQKPLRDIQLPERRTVQSRSGGQQPSRRPRTAIEQTPLPINEFDSSEV